MFGLVLSLLIIFSYVGWYFYSLRNSEEQKFEVNNNEYNIELLSEIGDNKTYQKDEGSLLQNNNLDNKSNILDKNIADISSNSMLINETQNKKNDFINNTTDDNVTILDSSTLIEEDQVSSSNQVFDIFDPKSGSKGFSPGRVNTIFLTDLAIAFSFLISVYAFF